MLLSSPGRACGGFSTTSTSRSSGVTETVARFQGSVASLTRMAQRRAAARARSSRW